MRNRVSGTAKATLLLLAVMLGATGLVSAHPKTVRITVTDKGFSRTRIIAEKGSPLTFVFTRTTRSGCGEKVVFPAQNISRNLPLGKPVVIRFTPRQTGELTFSCGMGMLKGTVVVH